MWFNILSCFSSAPGEAERAVKQIPFCFQQDFGDSQKTTVNHTAMEKRRSWFERLKRLFFSDPKPKQEKKVKRKKWLLGRLRTQQSFALPAPAEPATDLVRQAEDEQSKHAVAVAIATAAAAEAAVAAARAAAEVVRLTGAPAGSALSRQEQAAIRIQAVYRGYLARRALRALRGLVRLQAIIRGQAVRRQTAATLRGLESLMKIQSHARARANSDHQLPEGMDILLRRGRDLYGASTYEQQSKGWDSSTLSKEEMNAMLKSREEAALKRIRTLQYASLQNEKMGVRRQPMTNDELDTLNRRWSWLEEWVGAQPFDKDVPVASLSPCPAYDAGTAPPVQFRDPLACVSSYREQSEDYRLSYSARRSFVSTRRALPRDDNAQPCSPAFPGYMASTASAKAKFRSMSTPKERFGAPDMYSEHCFPFADSLMSPLPCISPIPSIASDLVLAKSSKPLVAQRSPRVKGPGTPVRSRSRRLAGHRSFGSESALQQLEQCNPLR